MDRLTVASTYAVKSRLELSWWGFVFVFPVNSVLLSERVAFSCKSTHNSPDCFWLAQTITILNCNCEFGEKAHTNGKKNKIKKKAARLAKSKHFTDFWLHHTLEPCLTVFTHSLYDNLFIFGHVTDVLGLQLIICEMLHQV